MPKLQDIRDQIHARNAQDYYADARAEFFSAIHQHNGERNIILYYSAFLQKPEPQYATDITNPDKNGFMSAIHGLDRKKGLDLILHTPGGDLAATESLVSYLHAAFGQKNIRVIVPQLAMSAGTMIACAAQSILMGKHSCLGPIDPQIGGFAAHGVLEEFERVHKEVKEDPDRLATWSVILSQYGPTLIGECEKAVEWANDMVKKWLLNGMLKNAPNPEKSFAKFLKKFGNPEHTKFHGRQFPPQYCRQAGLNIESLEATQALQDAVLSLHHVCMLTFEQTPACKIIENQEGTSVIS